MKIAAPRGMIEDATIEDEMGLFELLKENLPKLGGKKLNVRIMVHPASEYVQTVNDNL